MSTPTRTRASGVLLSAAARTLSLKTIFVEGEEASSASGAAVPSPAPSSARPRRSTSRRSGSPPAPSSRPRLVSFDQALAFIRSAQSPSGVTLVALDQPTIVPNSLSMRPVERAAASLVSWMGGGVQPANRSRKGMICDASPIWRFLGELAAEDDPEGARAASSGLHIIEVFPALALPSLHLGFFGRLKAPRYNPARRKTFRLDDWRMVAEATEHRFSELGLFGPAAWCREAAGLDHPRKSDQDRLDAMLCLYVAVHWRELGSDPSPS